MRSSARTLLATLLAAGAAMAQAQSAPAPTRGELLYNNHCIECHSVQMHWRDRKQARDWPTLLGQVQRWQQAANLQWSDEDVAEVARHLNRTIYRFAPPAQRVGRAVDAARATTSF